MPLHGDPGINLQGIVVAPFTGHQQDGVLMELGSNQRIHLRHVAAEPEQPASDCSQDQDALDDAGREGAEFGLANR